MTPHRGNPILFRSSQQLPRLRLVCCFWSYRDTRTLSALGAKVPAPGHRQQQLAQTLIVRLLKTHFFTPVLGFEKSTE